MSDYALKTKLDMYCILGYFGSDKLALAVILLFEEFVGAKLRHDVDQSNCGRVLGRVHSVQVPFFFLTQLCCVVHPHQLTCTADTKRHRYIVFFDMHHRCDFKLEMLHKLHSKDGLGVEQPDGFLSVATAAEEVEEEIWEATGNLSAAREISVHAGYSWTASSH